MDKGLLLVISGPSGSGKGSIIKPYMKKHLDCGYSISVTTRTPRKEDVDGVTYHFKNKEAAEEMISRDEFLEWDSYCGNYYGTPAKYVNDIVNMGKDCILELTVPGALNIKKKLPESIMIFIAPPSIDELKRRITGRGSEDVAAIENRMNKAIWELKMMENYDYIIINNNIDTSISELESIVTSERIRFKRQKGMLGKLGLF